MVNKSVAILCARGGSKRIHKKNIINFYGKPLLAWSIEAALKANVFDKVIVSTDDHEIAEIAIKYGAEVPFMRENHSDDFSPISLVVCDALNILKNNFGLEYQFVAQIMPNCPIRNSHDINASYKNFIANDNDFQISCFEYGWMNPWWAFKIDENNTPKPLFENGIKSRSQDLERLYCPTGAIWLAKTSKLLEHKNFYGPSYRLFPISWQSAVDIDNYEDLEMAKAVYLLKKEK